LYDAIETPLFIILYYGWLEGSLCGAQIPQKVPGYIQSSYSKFVNDIFTVKIYNFINI